MDADPKDVGDSISLSPYKPATNLRVCPPPEALPKTHHSLFALSNLFGWALIVISSPAPALILARIDDLQSSIDQAEPFSTPALNKTQSIVVPTAPLCPDPSVFVTHAAFAACDRLVVLATSDGALHIFSLHHLVTQKNTAPSSSIRPASSNGSLRMLVPNPSKGGPLAALIALVYQDGTITVVDCYDGQKTYTTSQRATAAEWSPMGKRLLVGYDHGTLEFLTHDGISKGKIDCPALLGKEALSVMHLKWLDQKNYIVTFAPTADQPSDEPNETYCLNVPKQSESPACTFARVVDAITTDGDTTLPPGLLTLAISVNPQSHWKHIAISSFTNSTSLTLVGYDQLDKPFYLDLEEGRPEIPVTEEDYAPSGPLGFALSYCSRQRSPLIWCYTTDGVLSLWKLAFTDPSLPQDLELWPEITNFSDISAAPDKGIQQAPSPPSPAKPLNSARDTSQTVNPQQPPAASQSSASGALTGSSPAAFGQPSLAFGQPSLATSQPSASAPFSTPATSTPSEFGSFAGSTPVAFGQSSLASSQTSSGSPAKPPASTTSGFGSFAASAPVAFGQSSLATSQSFLGPFSTPAKPATSTPSGFGSFASSSNVSAFGKPSSAKEDSTSANTVSQPSTASKTSGFSSFAASAPVAFGQPSLATSQTSSGPFSTPAKPATSTPAGFGSFASSSNVSTFVKPSSAKDDSTSGDTAPQPATAAKASGFGSFAASAPVAFGQPSVASSQTPLANSQASSAPRESSPKPPNSTAFGFSSFAASTPAAFGQPSQASSQTSSGLFSTPAKPATSTPSGFGSFASSKNVSAFGGPAPVQDAATSSDTAPQAATPPKESRFGPLAASTPVAFDQPSQASNQSSPASSQSSRATSRASSGSRPSSPKPTTSTSSALSSFAPSKNVVAFGKPSPAKDAPTPATPSKATTFSSFAGSTPVSFGQLSLANSQPSSGPFSTPDKLPTSTPSGTSYLASSSNVTAFGKPSPAKDTSTSSDPVSEAATPPKASGFGSFAASTPVAFGQSSLASSQTSSGPRPSPLKPPTSTSFGFGSFAGSTPAAFGQPSLANSQPSSGPFSSSEKPPTSTAFGFGSFASGNVSAFGKPSPAKSASTSSDPVPQAETPSKASGLSSFVASTPVASRSPSRVSSPALSGSRPSSPKPPPSTASGLSSFASNNVTASEKPSPAKDASTPSDTAPQAPTSKASGLTSFASSSSAAFGQLSLANSQASSGPPRSPSGPPPPSSGPPPLSPGPPSSSSESPPSSPKPPTSTPSGFGASASSSLLTFGKLSLDNNQAALGPLASSQNSRNSTPSSGSPKSTPSTPPRACSKSPTSTLSPTSDQSSRRSSISAVSTSPQSPTSMPAHAPPLTPREEPSPTPPTSTVKPPFLATRPEFTVPMKTLESNNVPKINLDSSERFPDVAGKPLDEALSAITDSITSEIDCLAPVGLVCRRYLEECQKKLQSEPQVADLSQFQNWAFGDLSLLYQFVQYFAEHTKQKKAEYESRGQAIAALDGVTIKIDMKLDEIKRLWRLRSDPTFSQVIRSRQLGPVQRAHQKDMRRLIRDVKHGISQMSEVLQSFDSRHREAKSCRNRMQTPSLDMINRCIRCITLGFTQHIIDLEKMHLRVRQHKVLTSSLPDRPKPLGLESGQTQKGSSRTPDQAAAVRALLSEHRGAMLKESILKHHTEPILTRARTLDELNSTDEPHGLSHIGITKTIIIMPRQTT